MACSRKINIKLNIFPELWGHVPPASVPYAYVQLKYMASAILDLRRRNKNENVRIEVGVEFVAGDI